jgi:hypothetical protein
MIRNGPLALGSKLSQPLSFPLQDTLNNTKLAEKLVQTECDKMTRIVISQLT